MMPPETDLSRQAADYRALVAGLDSLQLATSSENGEAEISYAPFLPANAGFYLFVSRLSRHTANMRRTGQAAIMFIQPEAEAANIFARKRLIYNCRVTEVFRDDRGYSEILDAMQNRFGEIVGMLRSLPDFHLLALKPTRGQYIAGFGQAFSVDIASGELLPAQPKV